MTNIFDSDIEVIDGQFVSQKVRQVVDAIREYDPEIIVQYVPVGARTPGQAAYRIVHMPMGHEPYVMFTVRRDEDMDSRILAKIIANDARYGGGTTLSEFEAWEAAQQAVERQKQLDAIEEMNDIAYHVLKTNKNTYKVNENLTIKDGIPFNAKDY